MRGQRVVLGPLNLRVHNGEHLAILGPNGSGKSTLIKTITRECYPLADETSKLEILGRANWNIFELRSHIGLVSNDLMAQCTRDITGSDLVLSGFFGAIGIWPNHLVTDEMRKVATAAMRRLDVFHLADRWVDELSSGEARRLLIARAMIHNPETLLLDEPTTSLDLAALHEIRSHLRKLASEGIGILLITHHLDDIIPEIDRVVLLKSGSIIDDGPKGDLLTSERLSQLYSVPVDVSVRGDYYHVW